MNCFNHNYRESIGTCFRCKKPFCDSCIITKGGFERFYCQSCLEIALFEIKNQLGIKQKLLIGFAIISLLSFFIFLAMYGSTNLALSSWHALSGLASAGALGYSLRLRMEIKALREYWKAKEN